MKLKILIFVVAYNAENTIIEVLGRIPEKIRANYNVSLLIIDDCSHDKTYETARTYLNKGFWCNYKVLKNRINQGYGGNQKIGYEYAIQGNFNVVILLHGDGQYAPEEIPNLLGPFRRKNPPDALFGSRMIYSKNALKGGMPIYKWLGNKVLTKIQNFLLNSDLSEFHSGFRIYSVEILKKIPFKLNTNDFHFDTEIIIQLFSYGAKVHELPIPTHYGDEICHVNGMKYAWDVIKTSIKSRIMKMGIFYDPKFSFDHNQNSNKVNTFSFASEFKTVFNFIGNESVILNLSSNIDPLLVSLMKNKHCKIYSNYENSIDLSKVRFDTKLDWNKIDVILLLNRLSYLDKPEIFLEKLRSKLNENRKVKIILSSGNISFFVLRLMMLFGYFNYSMKGILAISQKRLFTASSLFRLLKYNGYEVQSKIYLPAPYPLAIGLNFLSILMLRINKLLIKMAPHLFAYQIIYIANSKPETSWLLKETIGFYESKVK
jgi:hypothetical protein